MAPNISNSSFGYRPQNILNTFPNKVADEAYAKLVNLWSEKPPPVTTEASKLFFCIAFYF